MTNSTINKNNHNCVNTLKAEKLIKVATYTGTWSVIDDYNGYVLLEHNTWGDETCLLVAKAKDFIWKEFTIKSTGEKILLPYFETTYETYDDIRTALDDYDLK